MKRITKSIIAFILLLIMIIAMSVPAYAAKANKAETKAAALKQLGLYKGISGKESELGKALTRMEAAVVLVRSIGKEAEALKGKWKHPFTDVKSWADKYVGYAYTKGLIDGVSSKKFGTGNADSDMYLTAVLRALGYNKNDFDVASPELLAKAVGILPENADKDKFLCADAVLISWAALQAEYKGGGQTLVKQLQADKVFTANTYKRAVKTAKETAPTAIAVASEEELKKALSDKAVKAIEINSIGKPVIITGKLTIPVGVTLTVNRGNDFYIEGTLTNNGLIQVMGADSITEDFINYSVMSVQKGGKLINNGRIILLSAVLKDTEDHGPIGGQLRLFDGTITNKGSVSLKAGKVNTHGGVAAVVEGTFTNDGLFLIDGFFLRIEQGVFINSKDAVVINNTSILAEGEQTFTNEGTLSGAEVIK